MHHLTKHGDLFWSLVLLERLPKKLIVSFLHGQLEPFEWLMNLERIAWAIRTADEFLEWIAWAIRTADEFLERIAWAIQTADEFLERIAWGIRTADEFLERIARAVYKILVWETTITNVMWIPWHYFEDLL